MHPRRSLALALVLDTVCVLAFAAIGRASHDENVFVGLWTTAWPFLAGLVAGWLIARVWRAPQDPVRSGLVIWPAAVIGGMLLRAASGQGVAVAFVIVATITLCLALVGWRAVGALVRRRRARTDYAGNVAAARRTSDHVQGDS